MVTFKQVADIQTADMLKLPVPKANFHTEVIQPSELQQEMVRGLVERAEAIRAGGVAPRVDPSYDGSSNEYRMTMKGTLSHTAVLGADVFGNLPRMDNVIDGLPGKLEAVRAELADTQVQLENACIELAAPFAREAELAEKTARLKKLNILLNMDQKNKSLIDDVPDKDAPEKSKARDYER